MIMRKNIQMNCMFQLLLTLLLIAGCSSSDDGPESPDTSNRTVLRQDKDFSVNSMDLGRYVRLGLNQESADLEFTLGTNSVQKVEVRPANLGISYDVKGNKLTLLDVRPCKATVIINEDYRNPIYLFVDGRTPAEWNKLPASTIRYAKGTHTENLIIDQDNTTVFLEEGASLVGYIQSNGHKNIRILGYGVIDGRNAQRAIRMEKCSNIEVCGPVIMSRAGWTTSYFECDQIHIHDVKILGAQVYSDGIDLVGTSNVTVDNVFVRTEDDCIVIKTNKYGFSGNVENITVKNSVLWGGPSGNCMEIGWELDGTYLRNIGFENMDVVRLETSLNRFKHGAITIHQCGNSTISNVSYKNIRMEDVNEQLVWIELIPARTDGWGSGGGNIDNIHFENMEYTQGEDNDILIKKSDSGTITNVTFSGLKYKGKTVAAISDPIFDIVDAQVKIE